MQASLAKTVSAIRSSYWFVPSLMTIAAIALAGFMVWLDVQTGGDWLNRHIGWYQSIKPSGARDVLSTIAAVSLTVGGTAFSITIAALSFASGQFGPRLLTNFMGDRGNTITLGTFVASFVYCLFVLRTVREGPDGGFVPQLAVAVGLLMALGSAAVLIYFIHHVPRAININNVIAGIGRQLVADIDRRFPPGAATESAMNQHVESAAIPTEAPATVRAEAYGYIQAIEQSGLLETAERCELLLRLNYRPGDFVACGRPLLDAWPAEAADEEVCASLRQAFAIGDERTPSDDLNFLISELVEIAVRALSPGINDPMTAVACIDWLGAALAEVAARRIPEPYQAGKDGTVRVIALPDYFSSFVENSLGRLRQHVAHDKTAATHVMRTIGLVAANCHEAEQIEALDQERRSLVGLVRHELAGAELEAVEACNRRLETVLAAGPKQLGTSLAQRLRSNA